MSLTTYSVLLGLLVLSVSNVLGAVFGSVFYSLILFPVGFVGIAMIVYCMVKKQERVFVSGYGVTV